PDRTGVRAAWAGRRGGLDLLAVRQLGQRDHPVEQHEATGRLVTLVEHRADIERLDVALTGQPAELLVVQRLEQEQRLDLVRGQSYQLGHHSTSKYRCTNVTAIAPSPTAEATRFPGSARTSPAANTPGRLVSRWYGSRSSGQPCGRPPRAGPGGTTPRPSNRSAGHARG